MLPDGSRAERSAPSFCLKPPSNRSIPFRPSAPGSSARTAEEESAEALRDAALAVLRRVHPGVEVPEPTAYTVSKWASGEDALRREAGAARRWRGGEP